MNTTERLTRLLGVPVAQALPFLDGFLVLIEHTFALQNREWENLYRVDENGAILWKLASPSSTSSVFVGIVLTDGKLEASDGGHLHRIDPTTGHVIDSIFTK